MAERFDVVVLGMGPGGEVVASRLLAAGRKVAVVERELIGGECAYWACIPSKTLLRPGEARQGAARAAGLGRPELDWAALRDYRDFMVRHLDDGEQVTGYERQGATVVKGEGRFAGRTDDGLLLVAAADRSLAAPDVVVATGSAPVRPDIDGLDGVPVWTNREATALTEVPGSAVVLGGGAVAVELGQFLARTGSAVTLVQRGDRLITREEPQVGTLARTALEADGVRVLVGRNPVRAAAGPGGDGVRMELDDGSVVAGDVVVLATGRTPRVAELGLDSLGLDSVGRDGGTDAAGRGLAVDGQCRFGEGLWAVGDVTGRALFTHVAKYQARVAADSLLGRPAAATYEGIPRVIFADPEIAAVGLTAEQARARGVAVATAEVDLPESIARPWTYETRPRGTLGLLADADRGVLVGAWAVAPMAGEWIHQAALAIRAQLPLDLLRDQVAQFPTYTEGYLVALEQL